MTESEMKVLYRLRMNIKKQQEELSELRETSGYRSPVITGMPSGGMRKDMSDYAVRRVELEEAIAQDIKKMRAERIKLERYLRGVEDAQLRLILRLRYAKGMTWEMIGKKVHMEQTGVAKKHRGFVLTRA